MTESLTVHVWMPDGRSLCDRRARPAARTDAEFEEHQKRAKNAPSCGPCLLLVTAIRRMAAATLQNHPDVWPPRPSEAWRSLKDTRWSNRYDVDEIADRAGVDDTTRYDAFLLPPDPKTVDTLAAQYRGDANQ